MKKIIYSALIASAMLSSCKDYLDLEPITQQTETQFYKDEDDALMALVAVYDMLQWDTFELYSEALSENCYGGGASANDIPQFIRMAQWDVDPNDANLEVMWSKFYQGIYRANILLEKMDGITFTNEANRARFTAEALFLRAYNYWGLVRMFGNVPLILNTLEPSQYYSVEQVGPDAIFNQIHLDLTAAIEQGLPSRGSLGATDAGRVTMEAAQSLLVRIWMFYTGAYNQSTLNGMTSLEATNMIQSVIATSGASLNENFADNFSTASENSPESIFEIQYSSTSNWGDWGYLQGGDGNFAIIRWGIREPDADSPYTSGWSFAPVRRSILSDYEDGDQRLGVTVVDMDASGWSYTPGYQNTGVFNNKFTARRVDDPAVNGIGGSRELNFPNNIPVIRYSDVLLMASELLLESNISQAQTYYAMVVKRAMGAGYNVPSVSLENIRLERKREFAMEGIRYWDLRRYGLDYAKTVLEAENASVSDPSMQKHFNLAQGGLLPIPHEQITISNGVLKQNAGY